MKQTPFIRAKRRESRKYNFIHYIDGKTTKKTLRLDLNLQVVITEIKGDE